jgi:hypothetical protein
MKRPSRALLLGLAGLAIIAANIGLKVWQALGAPATSATPATPATSTTPTTPATPATSTPTTPTLHVCAAAHYKLGTSRCTQDAHTLTVGAAGRA